MRHFLFLLTFFLVDGLLTAEEAKPGKKPPSTRPAPISNYWDSNAWEKGSGANFWRRKSPGKQAPSRFVKTVRIDTKPKKSTSEHSDFQDRQTEK